MALKLLILTSAMAVIVTGCAQGGINATTDQTARVSGSAEATGVSVICDFFAAGGPFDASDRAEFAALHSQAEETEDTRVAIDGIKQIAKRASGEEKRDLLLLAGAMNDAAIGGLGYNGWSNAIAAFFEKYYQQCGMNPVAS